MQKGVMSYFFLLLWNPSQAPEMETSFRDSNRIKASGSHWSIGGSQRNPKMCKALSGPFTGTASLKQKGGSGLQMGKIKMLCPKALCYFQFSPGPRSTWESGVITEAAASNTTPWSNFSHAIILETSSSKPGLWNQPQLDPKPSSSTDYFNPERATLPLWDAASSSQGANNTTYLTEV